MSLPPSPSPPGGYLYLYLLHHGLPRGYPGRHCSSSSSSWSSCCCCCCCCCCCELLHQRGVSEDLDELDGVLGGTVDVNHLNRVQVTILKEQCTRIFCSIVLGAKVNTCRVSTTKTELGGSDRRQHCSNIVTGQIIY